FRLSLDNGGHLKCIDLWRTPQRGACVYRLSRRFAPSGESPRRTPERCGASLAAEGSVRDAAIGSERPGERRLSVGLRFLRDAVPRDYVRGIVRARRCPTTPNNARKFDMLPLE